MIRFLLRLLGLLSIVGALAAIVLDSARSIAATAPVLTSLGEAWSGLSPASLAAVRSFVDDGPEPAAGRWLWNPALTYPLQLPASATFGVLGFTLLIAAVPRRQPAAA